MSWLFSLLLIAHITTTNPAIVAHTVTATEDRSNYVRTAIVNSDFEGTYLFAVTNVTKEHKWKTAAITPALSNMFPTPSPGVWAVASAITDYIMEPFCAQDHVPLIIHCTSTAIPLGPRFQRCNSLRSIPPDNLQAPAIVWMLRKLSSHKFRKVMLVYRAEPYGEGLTKRIRDDIDGDYQVEEMSLDPSAGGLEQVGHTLNNKTDTVVVVLIDDKSAIVEALAHYSPDPDRTMILSETGLTAVAHCEGTCNANEALSKAWIVGLGDSPPELNEIFPGESHPYSFPCFAATQILLQAYNDQQKLPGKDLKSRICGKNFTVLNRRLEFASADLEEGACELNSWNYTIAQQGTSYTVQVIGTETPTLVPFTEVTDFPQPKSRGLRAANCTTHSSVCFEPVLSPGTASTCAVTCDCSCPVHVTTPKESATVNTPTPENGHAAPQQPVQQGSVLPQHALLDNYGQTNFSLACIVIILILVLVLVAALGRALWNSERERRRQDTKSALVGLSPSVGNKEVQHDIEQPELHRLLVRLLDLYEAQQPHKAPNSTHSHQDTTGCNTNDSSSSPPQNRLPEVTCDPSGQTLVPFSNNNNNNNPATPGSSAPSPSRSASSSDSKKEPPLRKQEPPFRN